MWASATRVPTYICVFGCPIRIKTWFDTENEAMLKTSSGGTGIDQSAKRNMKLGEAFWMLRAHFWVAWAPVWHFGAPCWHFLVAFWCFGIHVGFFCVQFWCHWL